MGKMLKNVVPKLNLSGKLFQFDSWAAMMVDLVNASNPNTIGWHFRHVYFLDGMAEGDKTIVREEAMTGEEIPEAPISTIPEHLHMLNHIFRSANHSRGESYID